MNKLKPYKGPWVEVCYHHKEILDIKTVLDRECYDCKYYIKFKPKQFLELLKTDRFWKGLEDKVLNNYDDQLWESLN